MSKDETIKSIYQAVKKGDVQQVKSLLSECPELAHIDIGVGTLLHVAARNDSIEMVRMLIDLGCDVNAERDTGNKEAPLLYAINNDQLDNVKLLLERGADPNKSEFVVDAVTGANESLEIIKVLVAHGADIHREYLHEHAGAMVNALVMAESFGKDDVVEYLRSLGAVPPGEKQKPKAEKKKASKKGSKSKSFGEQVVAYFEKEFGPVDMHALIEIVPEDPPIAVHFIPSGPGREHVTMFTTGMSVKPMTVSTDFPKSEEYRFAELFIQLPDDWPYRNIEDPKYGWAVRWLRWMAKYPHQNDTWLGGPVAIVDETDPPKPFIPKLRFNSMLFFCDKHFKRSDGNNVRLYRLLPLYPEERDLERREGIDALFRAFDAKGMTFTVDLKRPNMAK